MLLVFYIVVVYIKENNHYKQSLYIKTNKIIEGPNAPRGKIYDINGKVIADNKMINNLVFYNLKNINKKEVINKLSSLFEFENPSLEEMVKYYKAFNNTEFLLNKKEKENVKRRIINNDKKEKIIDSRIKNIVKKYNDDEKEKAKIYSLLSSGYDYEAKIIIKDVNDEIISKIIEKDIPGIKIESSFERYYPYDQTLKTIIGSVGKISKENIKEYLKYGYSYDDIIGISGLEKYYDDYLSGIKSKYLVNNDNSLTLISSEKKGNDLYLSIDIDLQMKIDSIIKENIKRAKYYPNTNYLTDSYVIMSNPKTGEIKAISGWRLLDNNEFNEIAINNITSSFTMGSVVKGATISVGYKYGLINPDEYIYDGCVKLYSLTEKCSWKKLGYLNSITALEHSSNYYQFLIAIKLLGKEYFPNMKLDVTKKDFDIYRDMLSSYGLGVKSGIDLPFEEIGLIGKSIKPDLLLNLAIGQYDTYTPIELITYINTIADNGVRRKPSLVKKIVNNKKIIYENKYEVIGSVDIKEEDMKRVQEGFYYVMNRGTGLGFMNINKKPAGKTGTSESFYDLNNDGKVDTSTLSLTLAGYYPYDDPNTSIIVVSPNASYKNSNDYIYYITSSIAREITSIEKGSSF